MTGQNQEIRFALQPERLGAIPGDAMSAAQKDAASRSITS